MGEGPAAALLQQIFEVDPLACPTCHGPMRIIACITQVSVIDQILTHLRTRATHAAHAGVRSPPLDPRTVGTRHHAATRRDPPRPLSRAPIRPPDTRPTTIGFPIPPTPPVSRVDSCSMISTLRAEKHCECCTRSTP